MEDREMSRSIVLECVPESLAPTAAQRIAHDYACVDHLLDYLNVECRATTVYMEKLDQRRPRLISAVLPASKFQRQAVKRAPYLCFFLPNGSIFLRASLLFEERQRMSAGRPGGGGLCIMTLVKQFLHSVIHGHRDPLPT